MTPLMYGNSPAITQMLLLRGANVEARDNQGLSVLFHALSRWQYINTGGLTGATVTGVVQELLSSGANASAKDAQGEDALFYFAKMEYQYHKACVCRDEPDPAPIVAALKAAGLNPNETNDISLDRVTKIKLLSWCTYYYPDYQMFKILVAAGMSAEDLSQNGGFRDAVWKSCRDCVDYADRIHPRVQDLDDDGLNASGGSANSQGQPRVNRPGAGTAVSGQSCLSNQQCSTGNCILGVCQPLKSNGQSCVASQECASRDCVMRVCQAPKPDGQYCVANQECRSGSCFNRVCGSVKPNGQSCVTNQECASRNCIYRVCQNLKPDGQSCVANQECSSGNCFSRVCEFAKPNGQTCVASQECASRNCVNRVCQQPH
jgi:hypothetical protein